LNDVINKKFNLIDKKLDYLIVLSVKNNTK